ncbi:hypothetical protein GCM10027162_69770 [Streptomyces incanus]
MAALVPVVPGFLQEGRDESHLRRLDAPTAFAHLPEDAPEGDIVEGGGEAGTFTGTTTEKRHVRRLGTVPGPATDTS